VVEAGYASSIVEAKEMNVRDFLQALHRIQFLSVYNETEYLMNRPGEA
jgi:hypothetical protein